jgi:predicted secreted protein
MVRKKSFSVALLALVLCGFRLWAGDTATFVDLGFSPDGKTYMFGQYGIHSANLTPWADLFVVDVVQNDYVTGGRVSYTNNTPVVAGQDGSGALSRLISRNTALAERYGISFLYQGRPLYISVENNDDAAALGETIEFRDFEQGTSYRATLIPTIEGSGATLKSSFYINVEWNDNGTRKTYMVGTPSYKRPSIASYRIRKVIVPPTESSVIFVVETRTVTNNGFDLKYMVEALRL